MKDKKWLLSKVFFVLLIVIVFTTLIYIFWEKSSPPEDIHSEYDEEYIGFGEEIILNISDTTELQDAVLEYVHSLKDECALKVIYVLLNSEIKEKEYTFCYVVDDIEGYYGVIEVVCCSEEEKWVIKSSKVCYYQGTIPENNSYSEDRDDELINKINGVASYIRQENTERLDKYFIKIFNGEIFIRGYEQKENGKIWDAEILIDANGEIAPITD